MEAKDVLIIVLREMTALGRGWRMDWSDFDGRTLRHQLNGIEEWAERALVSDEVLDYRLGTEFEEEP